VKILDLEAPKTDALLERFRRETAALRELDHPNIVTIRDAGADAARAWCVTEYIPGVTLATKLRAGPIGVRAALSIALQVATALELAHAKGVVHRDISPASIIVTRSGVAKLCNFAFAKNMAPKQVRTDARGRPLTTLSDMVGEVGYSSPQQMTDPRSVDLRTDLYSLGATLFHAISGRPAFEGASALEVFRLVISTAAPRLSEVEPAIAPKIDDVIARLLAFYPEERFQTAAELRAALEEALIECCGPAEEPEPAGTASRPAKEEPAAPALGGGYSGIELAEVIQFLEFNRKTGVLTILSARLEGDVDLDGGLIVGARAGKVDGEAAVTALLATDSGTFRFRPRRSSDPAPKGGLRLKPSQLAVEMMRRRDEAG
jgi:serine/threonine protein kinase